MIIDKIQNIGCYKGLGRNFDTAILFLLSHNISEFPERRFEIDGDNVYGFIVDRNLDNSNKRWEVHKKYADIQLIIDGNECIKWCSSGNQTIEDIYDVQKDVAFLNDMHGVCLELTKGDFIIFLPQDVHMPDCPVNGSSQSRKCVIKVMI